MLTPPAYEEFELRIEQRGGGTAAWTPALPQLRLFSYDPDRPLHDLLPVATRLMQRRRGKSYRVAVIPAGQTEELTELDWLPPGGGHRLIAVREDGS